MSAAEATSGTASAARSVISSGAAANDEWAVRMTASICPIPRAGANPDADARGRER